MTRETTQLERAALRERYGALFDIIAAILFEADPIDINYSMEKVDGTWKVYDVVIAGVSLVQNYRSTFASEIQKGGVDGLIAALAAKNKALAEQVSKK